MTTSKKVLRLAALGDLHSTKSSQGSFQPLFHQIASSADVLLLCGDLTSYGLPEEAHIVTKELTGTVKIPVISVLGNHDFESGRHCEIHQILEDAGVMVLDGDSTIVQGIGFCGVKGFGGGFGEHALQPWGEDVIKRFVHEAVEEAVKLESALARLRTQKRVVLLHYAPIQATVQGEPEEIYTYLGSHWLEDPIDRFHVSAVFHGHAHNGVPEGKTKSGIPVYNVSLPLLERSFPDQSHFRLVEIPL